MELSRHIATVQRQLAVAAAAGGQPAQELAERLAATLEAALRLTLLDVLGTAAGEITRELAPGSVDLRLRGGEPEFVVTSPPAEPAAELADASPAALWTGGADSGANDATATPSNGGDGAVSRINLRLPEQLKRRVEQAAGREGLSINAWLVRAAAVALDRDTVQARHHPPPWRGDQRYTGWVR